MYFLAHQAEQISGQWMDRTHRILQICRQSDDCSPKGRKGKDNQRRTSFGVAITPKLGSLTKQRTTKPRTMSLPLVGDDLHIQATTLGASGFCLGSLDSCIDEMPDVSLQSAAKVFIKRGATGEDNVLVETPPDVDGGLLDDGIDNVWQRGEEVTGVDFGVEKDLGSKEALISDIDDSALAIGVVDGVLGEPVRLSVVPGKLLDNVWRDVAEFFLDSFGSLEGAVGLATITQERLYKVGNVTTGDWDGFDGRADDVTLCDGDDVSDTLTTVDNGTGERAVLDLGAGPGSGESKDGLDSNVETGDVEGFEHDLGNILAVLGGVERLWQSVSEVVAHGRAGARASVPAQSAGNDGLRARRGGI